jgi:ATP-dependent Lon protease
MVDIKTNINLSSTFHLIQEIKKNIKQQCWVEISDDTINKLNKGLCITIQAKNYKTKESMYYQRIITEKELIKSPENIHTTIIKHIINTANNFFIKEQTKDICEECGNQLDNEEIEEGITICKKCAVGLYGYAAE